MHEAGRQGARPAVAVPLSETDGTTLAAPLTSRTDVPAFPASAVDGWAVRGPQPWIPEGRVLAGERPPALTRPGTCMEIATGAMVPEGTEAIVRLECAHHEHGRITGVARARRDWREAGEEVSAGEELLPAGSPVTPAVIGLAASSGHDTLHVHRPPSAAVLVFGDELKTAGLPGLGRIRDSLGPSVPSWLRRLGALPVEGPAHPVADTLEDHLAALTSALKTADIVCTTGGTMHGPADHLHPALRELGAEYLVDTVAVRPGSPMLAARLPGGKFVCGLPGNPQAALTALMTLTEPLIAGLTRRPLPSLRTVPVAEETIGRGDFTHLAAARLDTHGRAHTLGHAASSMLRGVAAGDGFVVVSPGGVVDAGMHVPFLPLPLYAGEAPVAVRQEGVPAVPLPDQAHAHSTAPR